MKENNEAIRFETAIHHLMALCGGLMGVYTIMSRMGVFAAAETTNMIEIVCDILGKDPEALLSRLLALLIYILGLICHTALKMKTRLELRYISIGLDVLAILSLLIIPEDVDPFLALCPLCFAVAFQWCSFEMARGYSCSTIFSTNNLKQTVTSAAAWFMTKKEDPDRLKKADRALFYGGTLLCFYGGAAAGYKAWGIFGTSSILLTLIPLFICGVLIGKQKHRS